MYRRHLPTLRTSHSNGMVSLRDSHRPSLRTLHRRHHRNLQILAGDLLPTNRTRRRSSHRSLLSTPRNLTPHEVRRTRRPASQKESWHSLGNAKSMARCETLQIPESHYGSSGFLFSGLEHVLAPHTHPLRPEPALQSHDSHPIRTLLSSTRLRLHPRNVFRRPVGRPHNHKMDQEARDADSRR